MQVHRPIEIWADSGVEAKWLHAVPVFEFEVGAFESDPMRSADEQE
jgi:hypothetical protein